MNIQQVISDLTINLTEQDILDRFYDRLRWPKKYPWGQPSVEVIFFVKMDISMSRNVLSIIKTDIV